MLWPLCMLFSGNITVIMDPAETVIYGPSTANQVSRNFVLGNSKLDHIINIPGKQYLGHLAFSNSVRAMLLGGRGGGGERGERLYLDFTDTSHFKRACRAFFSLLICLTLIKPLSETTVSYSLHYLAD